MGPMMSFLSNLSFWPLLIVVSLIPTIAAMLVQVVVQTLVGPDTLAHNNNIAGFKLVTVSVIYAVLLGFTILVAWERFNSAELAVDQEAGALSALFRYSTGSGPEATQLQSAITNYGTAVVMRDWPAMAHDGESHETSKALSDLYEAALALNQVQPRNVAGMSEMFTQIDRITSARRLRLHLSTGPVPRSSSGSRCSSAHS